MVTTAETGNTVTQQRRTAVGLFDHQDDLERVLNELKASGFAPEQVSLVAKDKGATREVVETTGMGGGEGAGVGAVAGGITGGLLGWLVGIGALAIPGIGPIVAAGALATTLGGAAIGAATGGLIGALVDLGIPEEEASVYQEGVGRGGMLLTVHANSDAQLYTANEAMRRNNGTDVRTYGGATDAAHQGSPMTGVPGTSATGNATTWDDASINDRPAGTFDTGERGLEGAAAGGAVGSPMVMGAHTIYRDEDRQVGDVNANPRETPTGRYEGAFDQHEGAHDQYDRAPRRHEHTADEMAGDAAGGTLGGVSGAVAGGVLGSAGGPIGTVAGAAIGGAVGAATGVAASEAAHDDDGDDRVVGSTGAERQDVLVRDRSTTPLRDANDSTLTAEERRAINTDPRR
jgi:hypothetical protein